MRVLKSRPTIVGRTQPEPSPTTDLLESFIGTAEQRKKATKRKKPSPGTRRREYIAEVERRISEQDWSGATPGLLVALYWCCHLKVYGVVASEIDNATTWTTAMKAAGNLVKFQFEGNTQQAILFMRWLWTREMDREQWRRKNAEIGRGARITWVRQFSKYNDVTDWRADKVRHQSRQRG